MRRRQRRINARHEADVKSLCKPLEVTTIKHTASIPAHEQVAEFRVGAILATQAIAVYIDSEETTGVHQQGSSFDDLPERLKIRILGACEDEFRRCKEDLIRRGVERGEWTLADLGERQA